MESVKEQELRDCPYCGKKQVWFEKTAGKFHVKVPVFDCKCLDRIKEQKEEERKEQIRAKHLEELFNNSLMSPFFQDKKFENLQNTEHTAKCRKYAFLFDPKKSKGIQMIGNIGTGKTTLLAAICNRLLSDGYKCLFTTFSDLLGKFTQYSSTNAGDITKLLYWLTEFDFVCLDDIGRETYTDKRKEIAFQIIDRLLNYKVVTAFTANPEMIEKLKKWHKLLSIDGINTKQVVKKEIEKELKRLENETSVKSDRGN